MKKPLLGNGKMAAFSAGAKCLATLLPAITWKDEVVLTEFVLQGEEAGK